ncbi:MAG: hypothetical protein M1130_05040 [Actinobacteria bacterium]|nr:hypothetical protein [Actinomycetota bacterium]
MPRDKLLASSSLLPAGQLLAAENSGEIPWWEAGYQQHVRVEMDMPWGVAGIRGTFWMNEVTPENQTTSVIDGTAEVTSNGVSVSVQAGMSTGISSPGAAPAQPAQLTAAEKAAWVCGKRMDAAKGGGDTECGACYSETFAGGSPGPGPASRSPGEWASTPP